MIANPGTCRNCKRRRPVYPAQRFGGGSYKRGGRWYWSSLCGECAEALIQHAGAHQRTVSQWSVTSVRNIVAAERAEK